MYGTTQEEGEQLTGRPQAARPRRSQRCTAASGRASFTGLLSGGPADCLARWPTLRRDPQPERQGTVHARQHVIVEAADPLPDASPRHCQDRRATCRRRFEAVNVHAAAHAVPERVRGVCFRATCLGMEADLQLISTMGGPASAGRDRPGLWVPRSGFCHELLVDIPRLAPAHGAGASYARRGADG